MDVELLLALAILADGARETLIRMQSTPEEQGYILSNLAEYLVAV